MHFSYLIGRFTNREIHSILNYSLAQLPPQSGPWHHSPWYKSHSISITAGLWGAFWNMRMLMHWVLFRAVSHLLGFGNLSFKSRSTNELVRAPDPLDSSPRSWGCSEQWNQPYLCPALQPATSLIQPRLSMQLVPPGGIQTAISCSFFFFFNY